MQVLKYVGGALLLGVAGFGVAVSLQPSTSHIERSLVIDASVADVQPLITDMNAWLEWNPWSAMDPDQTVVVSDPPSGVGAYYTWEGGSTGSGRLAITEVVDGQKVVERLEFTAPLASAAVVTFHFAPEGDQTKVTWAYDEQDIGFVGKAFGLAFDMDDMLGGQFSQGLHALAPLAAQAKADRVAAEAAAAAAAASVEAPTTP